jgi:hypothetical protein
MWVSAVALVSTVSCVHATRDSSTSAFISLKTPALNLRSSDLLCRGTKFASYQLATLTSSGCLRRRKLTLRMGIDIPLGGNQKNEGSPQKGQPFDILLAQLAFSNPMELPKIIESNLLNLDDNFFACKSSFLFLVRDILEFPKNETNRPLRRSRGLKDRPSQGC